MEKAAYSDTDSAAPDDQLRSIHGDEQKEAALQPTLDNEQKGGEPDANRTPSFESPVKEEYEYLAGFQLFMINLSVTLAGILLLLDTSIVSTVRATFL
jgi:hypothetical protein